ncbi:MAG TPA: dioxygenase [Steroidobacteraceae bacterium]|nr:dioxygenase [Steroidobacteraceae bacterium]
MSAADPTGLAEAVIARMSDCDDPRFKEIMSSLVRHLHAFVHEVDLRPQEWMTAIEFLTATGQACSERRQEFILLSDTLGVSMAVVGLDQARALRADAESARLATEATVQGPFYWEGAPDMPLGCDLSAEGVAGEPAYYTGEVTDTAGRPLAGALLDIWSGDGEGVYDMQVEGKGMTLRGRVRTDADGRYRFWSIRPSEYPVPTDGPVGVMLKRMGRHPMRPGHIHMKVSAEGHVPLTTHLFGRGGRYLDSDAVFGVRDSLIVDYERHEPGIAPDGRRLQKPYYTVGYAFRLAPRS